MRTITVRTSKEYDVLIGKGLLSRAGEEIQKRLSPSRAVIVTDSNVGPLYAAAVKRSLQACGIQAAVYTFPAGEAQKRLSTIAEMYEVFAAAGLTRKDMAVALGGGVTGDMCGFASATYLRGIPFVQIPTSLLAQVDSSVGGKTGVDLEVGKNLVGAFWQPSLVLCDIGTLSTLPGRYFSDGMAEAVKAGCIKDKDLFARMEAEDVHGFLEEMIARCIDIKRQVVENDEKEQGERMLLNFGHTLGHAIERLYHYEGVAHGEAVAVGMVRAALAGEKAGVTEPGTAARIQAVLEKFSLPTQTGFSDEELAKAAFTDKKRGTNGVSFVLLHGIGDSFLRPVELNELESFIKI